MARRIPAAPTHHNGLDRICHDVLYSLAAWNPGIPSQQPVPGQPLDGVASHPGRERPVLVITPAFEPAKCRICHPRSDVLSNSYAPELEKFRVRPEKPGFESNPE
jgi:hypothetical protein